MLDYDVEHYCPVYRRVISPDLCYDSLCCLTGMFFDFFHKRIGRNRRYRRSKERHAKAVHIAIWVEV